MNAATAASQTGPLHTQTVMEIASEIADSATAVPSALPDQAPDESSASPDVVEAQELDPGPPASAPPLAEAESCGDSADSTALELYARDHEKSIHGGGPVVRMSTANGDQSFLTSIVGSSGRQVLVIAAPTRPDGEAAAIEAGQRWLFRTIYHTTALRFEGLIKCIVPETSHLYVELCGDIERRVVRQAARVAVSMHATLLPAVVHALVLDLSIGGARFAIDADEPLQVGHSVVCSTVLTIADRVYALELKGLVLSREPPGQKHPRVAVYRMRFDSLSDISFLVLQAYLSAAMTEELDYFWRLIAGPST